MNSVSASSPSHQPEDASQPTLSRVGTTQTRIGLQALEALRFQDPRILRGTRISHVLHRRARILADRPCTAKHFEESQPVDHLDAFISHNWTTPREDKLLALQLQFNLPPAIAVTIFVICGACALQAKQVLPHTHEVFHDVANSQGYWCQLLGVPVFILSICHGHIITAMLPWMEPFVFLDKYCVHQTDLALKRQGIEHLPAMLSYSWRMVVLYSDLYLQKLWTVYEMATWLLLFPDGRLDLLPVSFPRVAIGLMLLICASRLVFGVFYLPMTQEFLMQKMRGYEHCDGDDVLAIALAWPTMLLLTLVCRAWARTQASIYASVQSFSISKAACQSEEDRIIVERNVAAFARHFELVDRNARDVEALRTFDAVVREQVPRLLAASLGNVGLPYRHAAMIFAVYVPYFFDSLAGRILDGQCTVLVVFGNLFWTVSVVFAIGPLSVALCFVLSKRLLLDSHGLFGKCRFLLVALASTLAYTLGIIFVANSLYGWSTTSEVILVVNGVFTSTLTAMALQIYKRSRGVVFRQRLQGDVMCTESVLKTLSRGQWTSGRCTTCDSRPTCGESSSASDALEWSSSDGA